MSSDEFDGWENLMGPEQRLAAEKDEIERAAYQSGYRAGYDEGYRDGYNTARSEVEAEHAGKVSKSERPSVAKQDSQGPTGSSRTD